jgi:5'-nucleotidase
MRILLTNDDGITAPGLLALKGAVSDLGEVFVVAPDRARSATGHAITLHKPLRLEKRQLPDGGTAYVTNGVPADCILLAINEVVGAKPDLMLAGINHGPNMGWDVTYSGTVAAAMEASSAGVSSAAISVASYDADVTYDAAAEFAARLALHLRESPLPERTFLNVNVPRSGCRGVRITELGHRRYFGKVVKARDPRGRDYYWIDGEEDESAKSEGTDVWAVAQGFISVTPLHLDFTDRAQMGALQALESFAP